MKLQQVIFLAPKIKPKIAPIPKTKLPIIAYLKYLAIFSLFKQSYLSVSPTTGSIVDKSVIASAIGLPIIAFVNI